MTHDRTNEASEGAADAGFAAQLAAALREVGALRATVVELETARTSLQRRLERESSSERLANAQTRLADAEHRELAIQVREQADRLAALRQELVAARESRAELTRELVATQAALAERDTRIEAITTTPSYVLTRRMWHLVRTPAVRGAAGLAALVALGLAVLAVSSGGTLAATAVAVVTAAIGVCAALAVLARGRTVPRDRVPPDAPAAAVVPAAGPRIESGGHERAWLTKLFADDVDPSELVVAGVLDEMSAACFGPECRLSAVNGDRWESQLAQVRPDLLLVESAWSGSDGAWQYRVGSYPHTDYRGLPQLRELVAWCRERDVPTVFWNKEDPVHFERFVEAAELFDVVLTTDEQCVERYRARPEIAACVVDALPFAAQPRLHNPIATGLPRRQEPCFAGTFYRDRHADRQAQMEWLLDAARPHGLVIYDRMHGSASDSYGFPERFAPHIAGRLPYEQLVEVYKRHKVFLNVNSVTSSPTMCSRRVFELLACDTSVLSTDAASLRSLLGDAVLIARDGDEAAAHLDDLLADESERRRRARIARRRVLSEHSYRERMHQIAALAGFAVRAPAGRAVAVIARVDDRAGAETLARSLTDQTLRPAQLIIGRSAAVDATALDPLAGLTDHLRIVQQETDVDAAQRARALAAMVAAPWVAQLEPGLRYDRDHLLDLLLATRFTDARVIGRPIDPRAENTYCDEIDPRAALVARELLAARGWPASAGDLRSWFRRGTRIYAIDAPDPGP